MTDYERVGSNMLEDEIFQYQQYLKEEKQMALNSVEAYGRDLTAFARFLKASQTEDWTYVTQTTVLSYVLSLREEEKSSATINRRIAAIRGFFDYMIRKGGARLNPALHIKTPKAEKKPPEYLSVQEVEKLLAQPDDSAKGERDQAILELLYATGMRVSELVDMNLSDVNIKMGFVACMGEHGKTRIIPLGKPARRAMETYLAQSRENFVKDQDQQALFLNYAGQRLTRQGLWKIIGYYAGKAGIKKRITPQILRHSFAIHMVQNGADLKSLQEMLGHEDVTATQVYLLTTRNRLKEVYDSSHPRA